MIAAEAMLRHLTERHDWRRCELHPLRAGSPLLEARVPPGCTDEVLAFEPCLVVEVPPGARELKDVLPRKIRANLGYFRRRAERVGRVSFETATAATLVGVRRGALPPARRAVAAAGTAGRARRSGDPTLPPRAPHRCCTARDCFACTRCAWTSVSSQSCTPWPPRRRTYCYLCGFDPEFAALSPGTLIFGHSVWQAVREGAREVDFLRGRERYKYFWGVRERPCYGRMLSRVG